MKKNKKDSPTLYGIIGLGRFGFALAKALSEAGKEILVLDREESKVREALAFTDNAFTVSSLSREALLEAGVDSCDVVAVCIGERLDTSILTTLTVIQLGVKQVISKAVSAEHGSVLELLGASVVYPERDMAVRLAKKLVTPQVLEFLSLSDDVDITEIRLTQKIHNVSVAELDLRKKYSLNIIAVRKNGAITIDISPALTLSENDTIAIVGHKENILRFERWLEE